VEIGLASQLALLSAEQSYAQAEIAHVQAQAARLADTAALFQALGGGWWNRRGDRHRGRAGRFALEILCRARSAGTGRCAATPAATVGHHGGLARACADEPGGNELHDRSAGSGCAA